MNWGLYLSVLAIATPEYLRGDAKAVADAFGWWIKRFKTIPAFMHLYMCVTINGHFWEINKCIVSFISKVLNKYFKNYDVLVNENIHIDKFVVYKFFLT